MAAPLETDALLGRKSSRKTSVLCFFSLFLAVIFCIATLFSNRSGNVHNNENNDAPVKKSSSSHTISSITSNANSCNDEQTCWSCTNHTSWTGSDNCRWCPLVNQQGCHTFGSFLNPCHANQNTVSNTDCELTPYTKGCHMVLNIVKTITIDANIFPNDNDMLRRIAIVESKDGTDSNTYRQSYYGGIWQVDKIGFQETQNVASHPSLNNIFVKIQQNLNINWQSVEYNDLLKPFYSALASRLYLYIHSGSIPTDIDQQAVLWRDYYNSGNGAGSSQDFVNRVQQYQCVS